MGWQDRQYDQGGGGASRAGGVGGGAMRTIWGDGVGRKSVTFWLLMINIGFFVIDGLLFRAGVVISVRFPAGTVEMAPLHALGYFSLDQSILHGQVWRLITFQFIHAGIGHILGNMIGLFFFGPMVERYWGSKRFLAFYLLSGVAGALGYMGLWGVGLIVSESWIPLVGASAGLFGVLVAAALIAPNSRVYFMMMFPIPLKVLIWVILGIAAYTVVAQGNQRGANAGGEAGHLGGALVGFLLMKFPRVINFADRLSPESIQAGYNKGKFERKAKRQEASQEEIDRILTKVSEKGLQSLSNKEKRLLQQDTDRLRDQ